MFPPGKSQSSRIDIMEFFNYGTACCALVNIIIICHLSTENCDFACLTISQVIYSATERDSGVEHKFIIS